MDRNPYEPPRPGLNQSPAAPISSEKESQVMQEIGRRRARTFSLSLGISWPVILALLMFGIGVGFLPGGIASGILAAGFAKVFVRLRKRSIIRSALTKHGVPPGALDPAKYILD